MNTFIFYSYYYSSRSLPQENLGGCGCCQSRVTLVTVCPFQQGTSEVETFRIIKVRSVFLCIKLLKNRESQVTSPLAGDHLRPSRGPSVLRHESPSRTLVNPTLASEREREASSSTVVRLDQNGAARTVMVAETELTDPSAVQINGGY